MAVVGIANNHDTSHSVRIRVPCFIKRFENMCRAVVV
jgi:hypothetical protein